MILLLAGAGGKVGRRCCLFRYSWKLYGAFEVSIFERRLDSSHRHPHRPSRLVDPCEASILPHIGDANARAELLEFFSHVVTDECVAPALGSRRLDGFWPDC